MNRVDRIRKHAVLILLINVIFIGLFVGILYYAIDLRRNTQENWNDMHKALKSYSTILTLDDFIDLEEIKTNEPTHNDRRLQTIGEVAGLTEIAGLYLYFPKTDSYIYLLNPTNYSQTPASSFFGLISGCRDEATLSNTARSSETLSPVYSADINASCLKAWVPIMNDNGEIFCMLTGMMWLDEILVISRNNAIFAFTFAIIVSFVILFLSYGFIFRVILDPVSQLTDDMHAYHMSGKINKRSEYGEVILPLREYFEDLANKNCKYTKDQIEEIRHDQDEMIQQRINSHFTEYLKPEEETHKSTSHLAYLRTPSYSLSGSFCDYFSIGGQKYAFIVYELPQDNADASLPLFINNVFWSVMHDGMELNKAASALSCKLKTKYNITEGILAFFGIYDAEEGMTEFIKAGYNTPFLCGKDGAVNYLTFDTDEPLGIGIEYSSEQIKLGLNEFICCFSNGVADENIGKELYGRTNLKKVLAEVTFNQDAADIVDVIEKDMKAAKGTDQFNLEKMLFIIKRRDQ